MESLSSHERDVSVVRVVYYEEFIPPLNNVTLGCLGLKFRGARGKMLRCSIYATTLYGFKAQIGRKTFSCDGLSRRSLPTYYLSIYVDVLPGEAMSARALL